jgi:hypothetical protein
VHRDWYVDVPFDHGASFDAATYDAAIEQLAADRSWQLPVDTVSRLALEDVDRDLWASGAAPRWPGWRWRSQDAWH